MKRRWFLWSSFNFSLFSILQIWLQGILVVPSKVQAWVHRRIRQQRNNGAAGGCTLWAWGINTEGELGLKDVSHRSSPVQVGTLSDWVMISSFYLHSLAIKSNGTLWAWGFNSSYQLGLGSGTTNRSSPTQVGALTSWVNISAGGGHSFGIQSDGTLWAWGYNGYGCLGLGDVNLNRSSPTKVGTLNNWVYASAGSSHSLGLRSDGTLWSWGRNVYGELGVGNTTDRSSPTQVGNLQNWVHVSAYTQSLALKSDGTIWAWGRNSNGLIGFGDSTDRSSPVRIGSSSNWATVVAESGTTSGYLTADGALYVSGGNGYGDLGLGDTTYRSAITRVGALNNWVQITNGDEAFLAVKSDGTCWSWGRNASGQLGIGNTVHKSSPVQIGTLQNWVKVTSGRQYSLALRRT